MDLRNLLETTTEAPPCSMETVPKVENRLYYESSASTAIAAAIKDSHCCNGNPGINNHVCDINKREKEAIYGHPLFPLLALDSVLKNVNLPHVPLVTK